MTRWKFTARDRERLTGVDPRLIAVAELALDLSPLDFAITEGVRSAERQAQLMKAGASATMNSRHLTGHAIDIVVQIGDRISWELALYCQVAAAFREASVQRHTPIRWGGCWSLLRDLPSTGEGIEDAVETYVARRRAAGKRALIDGPHFEIPAS